MCCWSDSSSIGGPRRCAASASGSVAGAGRVADGAALRPAPVRIWRVSGPSRLVPRRCRGGRRRVHREVRYPGSDILCRNGIRWWRGRLDAGRPPEVLAGQTRQRGPRQPRRTVAGGRRRRQPAGAGPARPAGGQARTAGTVGGLDADHRHGPHRRRRLSVDLGRADQAIIRGGFKVMPDDVRAALESHPAVAGAAVVGPPRRTARGDPRWRWWNCARPDRRRRRTARLPANPTGPL